MQGLAQAPAGEVSSPSTIETSPSSSTTTESKHPRAPSIRTPPPRTRPHRTSSITNHNTTVSDSALPATMSSEDERQSALNSYRTKLIESREWEAKLKNLRLEIKDMQKEFDRTEDNIKALQSVGQIIGEVLKQLDDERCTINPPTSVPDLPMLMIASL